MSTSWFSKYVRRIHMDFHTPEVTPDLVIKHFDAQRYATTLKRANVNALVTFTKGHHGNSYYATELGHRHSGLPEDLDMFGEILDACHREEIKVLAYYSVGWLTTVEKDHPEWMERNAQGEKVGTQNRPRTDFWNCICLNSPYVEQVVLPELREIVEGYPVDAVWLDIIENNPCHCSYCKARYRGIYGQEMPDDAPMADFVLRTKTEFIRKCVDLVKAIDPAVLVSYNTAGRDLAIVPLVDFCTIETHPGAPGHLGAWTHGLLTYKHLQSLGIPWESCTSRFIHGWGGWDDQTLANMQTVASRILAHGGVINLGDQTYPTGELDQALYEKIGANYALIKEMEPWAIGGQSVPSVAILATEFDIYAPDDAIANYLGAAKMLTEKHWHFDLVHEGAIGDLAAYECVVLPSVGALRPETVAALVAYVEGGGHLLATGNSSLGSCDEGFALSRLYGCDYIGMSDYAVGYLQVEPPISAGVRTSPLLVPGQFTSVEPHSGTTVLAQHIDPLIEPKPEELLFFRNTRLSPPGRPSDSPGIVMQDFGAGSVAYVAAPVFAALWSDSQWYLKDVADNVLDLLVPDRLIVLDAPVSVEMNVTRKEGRIVIHLINYHLQTGTCQVEEVLPVFDLELRVSCSLVKAGDVVMMPQEQRLDVAEDDGAVVVRIPGVELYAQVVFEVA